MSSLRCTIFGHKFQTPGSVETDQEQNQNHNVTVQKTHKECVRCNKTLTHKERTSVTSAEQDTSSSSSPPSSEDGSDVQSEPTPPDTDRPSSGTDGVTATTPSSFDSPGLATGTTTEQRDVEDDQGVMILKDDLPQNSKDDSDSDSGSSSNSNDDSDTDSSDDKTNTITCESCGFSQKSKKYSHRTGDICPKCGSWLSVGA